MRLFSVLGNQFPEELQSHPHMSLKNESLLLTVKVLFDTSKGHVTVPLPIFPLYYPTSS